MLGSHPTRWIDFLLCGAVSVLGCVGTTDTGGQGETGSLSVDLVLAGGVEIDQVGWQITGNGMDMSGDVDVSAPGSTASVEVYGLPPGEEDYTVTLTATSTDEEVTCKGSAPFDIEVGETTNVMVMLNCKKPRTLGGVRVNGKFNICTQLTKATAAPLETSVGNDIALTSQAEDAEMDPIAYDWTATSGSLDDPSAASTTYTCTEAGAHFITISVTDNDEYCDMATWTFPVTCVPGEAECMTDDDCDENEVCDAGQCVLDIECMTPADCDDENDCTANICADGTCANPNSDIDEMCDQDGGSVCDGEGACVACNDDTQCDMGEVCVANACVADVECMENEDCGMDEICVLNTCVGDPDVFCNEGLCATNDTARANCVEVFLACLVAEPANEEECLVLGLLECNVECLEDNDCEIDEVCTNNECVAGVECMMDSQCDDGNDCTANVCTLGECMNPNTDPDEMCNQDGGSVCDGLGACVECNASDQCPDAGECQVPICVANTCAQNNVMNGQVCDFSGSDGICEAGTCVEAPQCVSPGDCNDDDPCTIGLCTDGMCSFDPVAGGSCDPGTGSGDGTCSNTGTCVSNDECQANTDCSDDDGNECTVPVCDQTGVPYVCDEDPAPADGNACDGGSGTCQDGVCEVANPVISAGSGDTGWRALPRNCQTGWFENIDGPDPDSPNYPTDARVGCKLCLEGSCTGGTLDGRACSVDGDCPGGTCTVGSTPDPPDCELDCFAFTCEILTEPEFNLPTGGQAVYPTGGGRVANAAVRGCEVVSGTLKNQLAIDTNVFLNADSDGLGNLTVTYDVIAANAGLALAAPLANLNDVTVDTLLSSATPSSIQSKLDPALSGSSVGNFIAPVGGGQTGFVLSPDDVPPVTEAVTPTSFPNVLVNFDPAAILIELVIVSSGAPLDITGGSCTFNNPAGTCIGGLNAFDACDPSDPGGGPGGADCTASNPITPPGTCEATGGGDISLASTP